MKTVKSCPNLIVLVAIILLPAIPVKAEFKLIDLGTLRGDATSSAMAINDLGEIVGESVNSNGIPHAFSYRNGSMSELSTNPSVATAINDSGQIVGRSSTPFTNIETFTNFMSTFTSIVTGTNLFTNGISRGISRPVIGIMDTPTGTNIVTNIVTFTNFTYTITITNEWTGTNYLPTWTNIVTGTNIMTVTNILYVVTNIMHTLTNIVTTNIMTFTNEGTTGQPVLFRKGMLVNLFYGTNTGGASGINNQGEIAGSVFTNIELIGPLRNNEHAFVYRNGLTIDLVAFGGAAMGINNRGDIVGESIQSESNFPPVTTYPFLYRQGQVHDLGTLGGSSGAAMAINDLGEIVGLSATTSNAEIHAFLYRQGRMIDMGTLKGAQSYLSTNNLPVASQAYAINNWGMIVGIATANNGATHAFIYSDGTMTDLNDLVTLTHTNGPAGFLTLTSAHGINDWGQIVGTGTYWDGVTETSRAFLLEWRP